MCVCLYKDIFIKLLQHDDSDCLSGFHFLLFNISDFSKFSTLSSFNSFVQSTNIYAAGTVHLEGKTLEKGDCLGIIV